MKACLHEDLYTNIHDSIIHNSQKVERTKCPSTNECIIKVVYLYNGTVFSHKKE